MAAFEETVGGERERSGRTRPAVWKKAGVTGRGVRPCEGGARGMR